MLLTKLNMIDLFAAIIDSKKPKIFCDGADLKERINMSV